MAASWGPSGRETGRCRALYALRTAPDLARRDILGPDGRNASPPLALRRGGAGAPRGRRRRVAALRAAAPAAGRGTHRGLGGPRTRSHGPRGAGARQGAAAAARGAR